MTFFHMKDFGGIKSAGLLIKKQSARYLSNKSMEMVFLVIVVIQKIKSSPSKPGLKMDDAVSKLEGCTQLFYPYVKGILQDDYY